ncbi:MAG: hypothetical protein MI919_00315 [Holophagales bacterium]|nr:hypothetical protein [Holophagales bacterium]
MSEDAEAGTYGAYAYVVRGNPLELLAPAEPGRYEIRYQTDRSAEKKIAVGKALLVVE